jgi:hypothetical protein
MGVSIGIVGGFVIIMNCKFGYLLPTKINMKVGKMSFEADPSPIRAGGAPLQNFMF